MQTYTARHPICCDAAGAGCEGLSASAVSSLGEPSRVSRRCAMSNVRTSTRARFTCCPCSAPMLRCAAALPDHIYMGACRGRGVRKMSSDVASSSCLPRVTPPFSLVIPPTTYCPGSDVEGDVLLEFPQMQDEQIDEVVLEFRGRLKVYVVFSFLMYLVLTTSCVTNSRLGILLSALARRAGSSYVSRNLSGSEDLYTTLRTPIPSEYHSASICPRGRTFFRLSSGTNGTMLFQSCTVLRSAPPLRRRSSRITGEYVSSSWSSRGATRPSAHL